jgi:thiol-disulfide isomerase/thioredoxin
VLLVAASINACSRSGGGARTGELAPDFVLPRLDGSVQKLSNYRGKIVLVNMWATWCPPCIEEMPLLDGLEKTYGPRGLVVLGLAGDEEPGRVRSFLEKNPVSFDVLLDVGGEVGTRYGITGYPETFVVDREGRLRNKIVGPIPADAGRPTREIVASIETLLGG